VALATLTAYAVSGLARPPVHHLGSESMTDPVSLSLLGEFRWNVADDQWLWSADMFRIHGYRPGEVEATSDLVLKHTVSDAVPVMTRLLEDCRTADRSFSNRHGIVGVDGRERLVLTVGRSFESRAAGRESRRRMVRGFMADVNEVLATRRSDIRVEDHSDLPVVQQTVGAIMAMAGLSELAAAALVETHCAVSDVKVPVFATRFVGLASAGFLGAGHGEPWEAEVFRNPIDPAVAAVGALLRDVELAF
jgi:hypothetical protein